MKKSFKIDDRYIIIYLLGFYASSRRKRYETSFQASEINVADVQLKLV